jgi:hypothetical protein
MMLVLQIAVSALVALAVVGLTHLFTSRRDLANKRREQRISYLVGAFRLLAKANHHPRLYEIAGEVQQAVADIQLFGTSKQVAMAREFAMELGTKQSADIDGLLVALRDDFRAELGAEVIPTASSGCASTGRPIRPRRPSAPLPGRLLPGRPDRLEPADPRSRGLRRRRALERRVRQLEDHFLQGIGGIRVEPDVVPALDSVRPSFEVAARQLS